MRPHFGGKMDKLSQCSVCHLSVGPSLHIIATETQLNISDFYHRYYVNSGVTMKEMLNSCLTKRKIVRFSIVLLFSEQ